MHYRAELRAGPGAWQRAVNTTRSTTFHAWTSLQARTTYTVRVRAHNLKGFGDWAEVTAKTSSVDQQPPAAPAQPALAAGTPAQTAVVVTWKEPDLKGLALIAYQVVATMTGGPDRLGTGLVCVGG